MKDLAGFLLKEMPLYAKEIHNILGQLYDNLDSTQLAIEEKLPMFKGNYVKIGEYYSMSQELIEIKKKVQEVKDMLLVKEDNQNQNCFETEPLIEENEIISEMDECSEDINNQLQDAERINYDDYRIDDSIPHGLSEDFTYKRPTAFEYNGAKYSVKDWKQMLLMFCEILYNKNHTMFYGVVMQRDMQGKTRVYFSDEESLYKPMVDGRKISGSKIFVETNHSANTICGIIKMLLKKYHTSTDEFKIFLRADYSPLHQIELRNENKSDEMPELDTTDTKKEKTFAAPDDYRFIKESYIKKSDPAMEGLSQRMGTPSHIEYLRMKDGDTRRHKSRCVEYDKKKDICMCTASGNYLLKCGGSSHCKYYTEEDQQAPDRIHSVLDIKQRKSKPVIKVIDKKKAKQCPSCKRETKKEWLIVTHKYNGECIKNKLTTYRCDKCEVSYIAETLFRNYTRNKNVDNIDVKFIQE